MAHDTFHRPPEEAVWLAVESCVAALTEDEFDALVARTRAPKIARYPARKRRNASREVNAANNAPAQPNYQELKH
jgi:hypothetical protein